MDQKCPVLDIDGDRLAVHCQFDCRHIIPPGEFVIRPIRDRGPELCNWEIGRENHPDAPVHPSVALLKERGQTGFTGIFTGPYPFCLKLPHQAGGHRFGL
jgi:hypothetical protein